MYLLGSIIISPFQARSVAKYLDSILSDPDSDLLTKEMKKFKRGFPTLYKTIVEERDVWLACKCLQVCVAHQGRTAVAVVGKGHVGKIEEIIGEWMAKGGGGVHSLLRSLGGRQFEPWTTETISEMKQCPDEDGLCRGVVELLKSGECTLHLTDSH